LGLIAQALGYIGQLYRFLATLTALTEHVGVGGGSICALMKS